MAHIAADESLSTASGVEHFMPYHVGFAFVNTIRTVKMIPPTFRALSIPLKWYRAGSIEMVSYPLGVLNCHLYQI